ncbi:MAG: chromate efflux transporter [Candidatus Binatia bacterium]
MDKTLTQDTTSIDRSDGSFLEVFLVALRLGLTSFGGPIAHLGYFRDEYVVRRKWLDERGYADLVALCQFLPGPASSQVGMALGIARAGLPGALAAWLGFTLPSALALALFAFGVAALGGAADAGWLHGLKIVAVAVVAQAVWGMAKNLCPDRRRATLAILTAVVTLAWPSAAGQLVSITAGGIIGWLLLPSTELGAEAHTQFPISKRTAIIAWIIFFALLFGLPIVRQSTAIQTLEIFDSFFRVGSLVFGGGHVVLPLLQAEVVAPGWITNEQFVAGYGAAQAVPGPLFTFSAYIGAMIGGWSGAILCLAAIFLPAFLLVVGALPFWETLRSRTSFQSALSGVNAAVVGLLLAALYQPVWTSAIMSPGDFALGLIAFGLLISWQWASWLVVVLTAVSGELLTRL